MKVRCVRLVGSDGRVFDSGGSITVGRGYPVASLSYGPGERGSLQIITNQPGSLGIFDAAAFETVDPTIPSSWVGTITDGRLHLGPASWQADGFWEAYYDRSDPIALRQVRHEIQLLGVDEEAWPMEYDLVKFPLPAGFILDRVRLQPAELVYGYTHGWLTDANLITIAESALISGAPVEPAIEQLAVLFSHELGHVPQLVSEIPDDGQQDPQRVWLFLALAWLDAHRHQFTDPLVQVEMLYADFDHPAELEPLVRWLQGPADEVIGPDVLTRNWKAYLQRTAREYAERRAADDADSAS